MSIKSYFLAKFYDASMRSMECACLAEWRRKLLCRAEGEVLEIGAGTGANLAYYPTSVSKLVLTEPDRYMRAQLVENAADSYRGECRIESYGAERIELPDRSFDTVVSTLVLCSVSSPSVALMEMRRLLRPGGSLLFIEHVVAKDRPRLHRWQRFFNPAWRRICGNCHLTRDTEQAIMNAGFEGASIERTRFARGPDIVSPVIIGVASVLSHK